jgi:hypothetical protein
MTSEDGLFRRIFMVLSPRSLSYARLALRSLYRNCYENFKIHLITDSEEDKRILADELEQIFDDPIKAENTWTVNSASDLDDQELDKLGKYDHIRNFVRAILAGVRLRIRSC